MPKKLSTPNVIVWSCSMLMVLIVVRFLSSFPCLKLLFISYRVSELFEAKDSSLLLSVNSLILLVLVVSVPVSLFYHFHAPCLEQRSGWPRDIDAFFQWLSAIPFAGSSFNDATIA